MGFRNFRSVVLRIPAVSSLRLYANDRISYDDKVLEEAVFIASKDFWRQWKKSTSKDSRSLVKIEETLLKYSVRICTRCTPFSTFAGIAACEVSSETTLQIKNNEFHRRVTRLDSECLSSLIKVLLSDPAFGNSLKYNTNSSLVEIGDRYRFVASNSSKSENGNQIFDVSDYDFLTFLITNAKLGIDKNGIAHLLSSVNRTSIAEALSLADELIESQIMVPALQVQVTGDPLERLVSFVNDYGSSDLKDNLFSLTRELQKSHGGVEHYELIESIIDAIGGGNTDIRNKLQVDLFIEAAEKLRIEETVVAGIVAQIDELSFFSRSANIPDLTKFERDFIERFDQMEVPLSLALDKEFGVGYGMNADDFMHFDNGKNDLQKSFDDHITKFSVAKYNDFCFSDEPFITITEKDLEKFDRIVDYTRFPRTMMVSGCLLKRECPAYGGRFQFEIGVISGPSAANLLGRFADGDEGVHSLVKGIISIDEEDQAAIYAEVVHLPVDKIGNVIHRPVLREYEIAYLGSSGAMIEKQISIDDIMVSIRDKKVVLRSKKHNRRVIPRLSTAHNYRGGNLVTYKFLCDIQCQGCNMPVLWDWGSLQKLKFLPRVVFKDLIICKARWNIEAHDIETISALPDEKVNFFRKIRLRYKMPSHVTCGDGDQKLVLDLENERHINYLEKQIWKSGNAIIEEFLHTPDRCVVTDSSGDPYTNELLIPIYREPIAQNTPNVSEDNKVNQHVTSITRDFLPGDAWRYFKVYSGEKEAERLLSECIRPFVNDMISEKLIQKFFFIRYRDPKPHLRIRMYSEDIGRGDIIQGKFMEVLRPYVNAGVIANVEIAIYRREIERYGWECMVDAESLFYNDSLANLTFAYLFSKSKSNHDRLLVALRSIDALFSDFGYCLTQKHALIKSISNDFFLEFGGTAKLRRELNSNYRQFQSRIFSFMDASNDMKNDFYEFGYALKTRSRRNEAVVDALVAKTKLSIIDQIIPSYVHMNMNRLFVENIRNHELYAYHHIEKFYASMLAIASRKFQNNCDNMIEPE